MRYPYCVDIVRYLLWDIRTQAHIHHLWLLYLIRPLSAISQAYLPLICKCWTAETMGLWWDHCTLELSTNLCKVSQCPESSQLGACLAKCINRFLSWHFQQRRSFLRDCEIFPDLRFQLYCTLTTTRQPAGRNPQAEHKVRKCDFKHCGIIPADNLTLPFLLWTAVDFLPVWSSL